PCDDSLYVDGVDTTYLGKFYYGHEMQRLGMNTVEIDTVNERECKRTVFHKVYVLQCADSVYVDGVDTVYVGSIYYGHEMQRLGMNTVEIDTVNERECKRTVFHKVYVLQCADSVYVDGVDTVYVGSIYYGHEMQRLGMNTVEIDTVNEMGCKRSIFHDVMVLVCDDSIYAEEIDYIHVGEMYYGQNMYLPGLNTVEEEIVNDHGCRKTIFHRVMVLEKEESVEPKDTIDKKDPIVEPVIPEIPETPIVEEEGNKEENEEGEGNKEEDEEGDDVPEIKIPTAFSPYQKDGKNDIFMKGYEVYIYDRYSNLVFHSTNGWDGRSGDKLVNAGVYVYAVKLQTGEIRRGTIEVLKRK
ncbi:MAG: gliding motility-associated C-terminal domain-containing protein, partial [Paludibacteraceae bacterium]|nr:gliding motility-associated C-terminal domain-containing protein [Paludibacteraceae bacterium]